MSKYITKYIDIIRLKKMSDPLDGIPRIPW